MVLSDIELGKTFLNKVWKEQKHTSYYESKEKSIYGTPSQLTVFKKAWEKLC